MNTQRPARQEQHFSVANFLDYGQRHGIDYRFPSLMDPVARPAQHTVVQGHVDEILLPSGISVTCSDLRVLEPYETTSVGSSPLYILVMVEGSVHLWLNGEAQYMQPGMALATSIGEQLVLHARHQQDQHLVTISLGIQPGRFHPRSEIATLLSAWQQKNPASAAWHIPDHLLTGLRSVLQPCANPVARQLMLEGLLLQLLAQQLLAPSLPDTPAIADNQIVLPPGERSRLEQVRQLLAASPEHPHTLDALARIAAMSPSSLRCKFRQTYGDSVFNYLRDCRLALARRYLQEGHSVQQAAWMSGYQHATNFATAFRRRYGVAPSALHSA
ncbi:helix-turn-helix transcriptional regulator [Erwiniaceae bacterium BAC15a-03b]|uniref:Helix-turn-helix transcriptional regulator n=1 Tax=Winslowiella arboricola TaxID=2978220 RepID=A0A9J6PVQ3_9GAMM|nr:AraC family transcriptional regulator [Winslowiella arboricola]MCU5774353.1 helix-turn-helix transcriptional regulator [Winslowiella arboricola]MCU5778900.1 helix-turn-helix transcriptional regulator [Winslowiella arboricola]